MYLLQAQALLHLVKEDPKSVPLVIIIIIAAVEFAIILFPSLKNKALPKTKPKEKTCKKNVQSEHEKRFESIEDSLKKITLLAAIGVMYNTEAKPLEQFNAAILYFKLYGNGNAQERVVEIIMQHEQNRSLWKSALNDDMIKNGPCEDRYFLGVLEWIDKQIG